jgi:hypothetical protein
MAKRTRRLNIEEMQQALQGLEGQLPEDLDKLLHDVVASYAYIGELVSDETMTVRRLRKMLWGGRRQKCDAEINRETQPETPPPTGDSGGAADV